MYQKWDIINGYLHIAPAHAKAAVQSSDVVLYSTQSCGYCAKARKLLHDNNIEYTEYDIEQSGYAATRYRSLGGRGVPLLVINGIVVHGYQPGRILDLAL